MSWGDAIEIYKEVGLPRTVADRFGLSTMKGTHGIGHTRMATESAVTTAGSHPFATGADLCLVHNGSLSNHHRLRENLRKEGLDLIGPLPADTLFTPRYLDHADAVLAMYHDQGLPVLKYSGFGRAVNITLGLPIIRTSVDHGTACDLAGTGNIDTGSLRVAIDAALSMANNAAKL